MSCQYPKQFDAGIASTANDAYFFHLTNDLYISMMISPAESPRQIKKPPRGGFPMAGQGSQRFENCLRRRALCRPTFFRSTSLASRVIKPALLKTGFKDAS